MIPWNLDLKVTRWCVLVMFELLVLVALGVVKHLHSSIWCCIGGLCAPCSYFELDVFRSSYWFLDTSLTDIVANVIVFVLLLRLLFENVPDFLLTTLLCRGQCLARFIVQVSTLCKVVPAACSCYVFTVQIKLNFVLPWSLTLWTDV